MQTVQVRTANAQDNELLAEIGAETFADSFGAQNSPEDMELYLKGSFSPELQAAELADPATIFLIAEVDGDTVGYARLREGRPSKPIDAIRPIEIIRFYARAPWIGKGIGAALMRAALEESQRRGCDVIWLDVWEQNEKAIRFYRKWEFSKFGTQPFQLGNDVQNDLLMSRLVPIEGQGATSD